MFLLVNSYHSFSICNSENADYYDNRRRDQELTMSYVEFLDQFQAVLDQPDQRQSSSQRLLSLRQGSSVVSDYGIGYSDTHC